MCREEDRGEREREREIEMDTDKQICSRTQSESRDDRKVEGQTD